jgi:TnpA family transposase
VLRRINAQHVNAEKLEAAMVDVINQYVRFPLPRHWGTGQTAIADGTHVKLRENNLLGSRISCGVWEAVHADTQGQSEPVFGFCRLVGIKLMPRMRGLSDAAFYRPSKSIRYQHIDALFGDEIDWNLIATHARDMIQVVLSIQAGRVMPSMLLRKLGTYNRKSLLYRAFRELGRVERTLFVLRFITRSWVSNIVHSISLRNRDVSQRQRLPRPC